MRLTDAVFTTAPLKKFTNYKNLGYKYKVIRVPALKDEVKSRKMVVQSKSLGLGQSKSLDLSVRVFEALSGPRSRKG